MIVKSMGGKYPYIYAALLWESFPTTLFFVPAALNDFPDYKNTVLSSNC